MYVHLKELLGYTQNPETSDWVLAWHMPVSAPILGIRYADLTGDGVKEVIVITATGVQVQNCCCQIDFL